MKTIELDVTDLIEHVKKEQKLFYPVMMYILLKALKHQKNEFYYELNKGQFLKTTFDEDFKTFYQEYVLSCYENIIQKQTDKNKIVFGLTHKGADFLLYPFKEKNKKTVLTILINADVAEDFEALCQEEILSFL